MTYNDKEVNILLKEIDKLKKQNEKLKKDLQTSQLDYELYKNFFKNNTLAMLLIDPYTGDIIDANQAACTFYGYEKNKIIKINISQINMLPKKIIYEEMNSASEKMKNNLHFKHRLANGEVRDVDIKNGEIEINDKRYAYFIVCDITEKNQARKLLEESEKKFKNLFNTVNDALFFFKVEENGMPGNFIEVNNLACERLGYSYEEMLNLSPVDIDIHEKNQILNMTKGIYLSDRNTFETVHVSKDSRYIPVEISTHVSSSLGDKFILAVARDITQRKKIEKRLMNSIEKRNKILSFLPDAVFVVQKEKIVFINEHGVNLLGYSCLEEIMKREYLDIVHPDYRIIANKRLRQLELKKESISLIEEKYIKKNGESIDVEVTGVKIPCEGECAFLIVARDISERKYYKRQLNERIEFERLRTEFFANISHELRTPLNVILAGSQLGELYIDKEVSVNYKKTHKRMKQNCYRLLRLINNIIDITKIDTGFYDLNLENFDLVNLIRDIVSSVEDYAKNKDLNIELKIDIDNMIITACDPEKIERVMLNLLSNSIKFTEPGGKIEVNISKKNNNIIISLKDSGIGMPEEKIQHIFDRFVQVDKSLTRRHEGSGIGLSLVKSIVNLHGGDIIAKSEKDKGSEFIISLPIKEIVDKTYTNKHINAYNQFNIERMNIEFSDIYLNY